MRCTVSLLLAIVLLTTLALPGAAQEGSSEPPAEAGQPEMEIAPSSFALAPGELGAGWVTAETRQDAINEYSSGRYWITLRQGEGFEVSMQLEVFRDVPTAVAAILQSGRFVDRAPLATCDQGYSWLADSGSTVIDCRRANVTMRVFAPTLPMATDAIASMLKRVNAGLA